MKLDPQLYQQIGQLKVERDFLTRRSHGQPPGTAHRWWTGTIQTCRRFASEPSWTSVGHRCTTFHLKQMSTTSNWSERSSKVRQYATILS